MTRSPRRSPRLRPSRGYNVVDHDPRPWPTECLPALARWVGAPQPPRVSVEDALKSAGKEAVYYHTRLTAASNSRAKAQLGFAPRPLQGCLMHFRPWRSTNSDCALRR
ncbi:hypothetical protein AJ87_35165 [Rhizobium yanglingense]|nr:hypothetical protein AJ87_35165 [Rhizobium yanglingense]